MREPVVANDTVVEVRNLKKYYPIKGGLLGRSLGAVKAVDGISFRIPRGTTMGLVGESGCGKTTVGRTLLRLTARGRAMCAEAGVAHERGDVA